MKLHTDEVINLARSRGLVFENAPSNIRQAIRFLINNGYTVEKKGRSHYQVAQNPAFKQALDARSKQK